MIRKFPFLEGMILLESGLYGMISEVNSAPFV